MTEAAEQVSYNITMPRLVLLLTICLALSASAATRRRAVIPPPVPQGPCSEVRGLANFFISRDGGRTFTTNREPPMRSSTWGFTAFADDPQRMIAAVGRAVWESADGGCSWTLRHTITETIHHPLHIVPASGGRAYLWTEEFALRYDGEGVTALPLPETIGGLGVDAANREHVRALGLSGASVWESFDGGTTWKRAASGPGRFLVSAAFDPSDFDHILAGVAGDGAVSTRNAGRSWSVAGNFSRVNVCGFAFVTARPNVVWATISTRGGPFVFRSTDGGSHFEAIGGIDGIGSGMCVTFVSNPHDPNVAHVAFGGLYTYDATSKSVIRTDCCGAGSVSRIAYSPADPDVVFLYSAPQ